MEAYLFEFSRFLGPFPLVWVQNRCFHLLELCWSLPGLCSGESCRCFRPSASSFPVKRRQNPRVRRSSHSWWLITHRGHTPAHPPLLTLYLNRRTSVNGGSCKPYQDSRRSWAHLRVLQMCPCPRWSPFSSVPDPHTTPLWSTYRTDSFSKPQVLHLYAPESQNWLVKRNLWR